MQKILVTGANGMLGQDLVKVLEQNKFEVVPTDLQEMDITNLDSVKTVINQHKPDYVIHAAAYTNVDGAETEKELAFLVNYKGVENIAIATKELDIPAILISTDYIFDGKKGAVYEVNDAPNPLNVTANQN